MARARFQARDRITTPWCYPSVHDPDLKSAAVIVWSIVLPFITLVLGWGLSQFTEYFKGKRDRAAKALERREARLLRRNEFQRETLLSVQEALTELSESTGMRYGYRSIHPDNPNSMLVPHSVLEAYRKANTQVVMLRARVHDESIRIKVGAVQSLFNQVNSLANKEEAQQSLDDGLQLLFELNDQIGQALRELDAGDDQLG